jgi:hypothetical protein
MTPYQQYLDNKFFKSTTKEKAEELVNKYIFLGNTVNSIGFAKQCSLIAVDEILSLMIKFHNRHIEDNSNEIIFWELVKEEINLL